jgi:gamma-glutamyltranspeptidase/glutathione hydrolase
MQQRFRAEWPGSARLYLPGDRVPESASCCATKRSREHSNISQARRIRSKRSTRATSPPRSRASRRARRLACARDLAAFETKIEEPVSLRLGDTELFKTGFWSQGPAELQALALMWQHDLRKIGFGTADYCHLLIEAMKLAYADREQYYGDPAKTWVPGEILLSDEYARRRAGLIDMRRANRELRPGDARRNAALLPTMSASSRRIGERAPCMSMLSTQKATWRRLLRAGRGSRRPT